MALKHNITVTGEVTMRSVQLGMIHLGEQSHLLEAVVKVHSVTGTKEEITADVRFVSNNHGFSKQYRFKPQMSGDNFIRQTYLHLKSLPEFKGAEDI
jgi:hypothetical protein